MRKIFNQRERERERKREREREREKRERTSGLNLTIFVSHPDTKNLIYLVSKPARFCSDH